MTPHRRYLILDKLVSVIHHGRTQLPYVWRALSLAWNASRSLSLIWVTLLVVQGLLPAASVWLTRPLINSLVVTLSAPIAWPSLRVTLALAVAMILIQWLSMALQAAADWVRTALAEQTQDLVSGLVQAKASSVDLAFYESVTYHDQIYRASSEASVRTLGVLDSVGSMLQNGVTLLAVAGVLVTFSVWLPVALLVAAAPTLFSLLKFNRRYHRWWEKTTVDRRRADYYNRTLTDISTAAELRLFGWGDHVQGLFRAVRSRLRSARVELARDQSIARLIAGTLSLLVTGGVMLVFTWRTVQGVLTLGDLGLLYQAFSRGQGVMQALFGSFSQIYAGSLFMGNLSVFLALHPQVTDPVEPISSPSYVQDKIQLRNVSFRYPGSSTYVFTEFNVDLPADKLVAIVGPNGAGKTTLVKLLCRFYDPETGNIEIDGVDIRRFRLADYRRMVTFLAQFPAFYEATAAENIAIGDSRMPPDLAAIRAAAQSAGADDFISLLPYGYDTPLGKWLSDKGTEISGGEWQRIALARAYYRQAPIMLLDEPTSFMDSWSETLWFTQLRALTKGRTTVLITHRFTIAMRADLIYVMDGGQIVEAGTHADLLVRDGLYAHSWHEQMQTALAAESNPTVSNAA